MRVPEIVRKSVIFVGRMVGNAPLHSSNAMDSLQFLGTGFFIGQPSEFDGQQERYGYFVTAKHVIDSLEGQDCWARLNNRTGSAEFANLGKRWWFHPTDSSVDVAVLPFAPPPEHFDFAVLPTEMFATDEAIEKANIGVGDEVFLTGLFAHQHGDTRNLPIVRIGNIALMAGEPVQAGDGKMEAHLIEARSIGGLSGSPAFVRQTISIGFAHPREFDEHELYRKMEPGEMPSPEFPMFITGIGPFFLLGLMHGHWDIPVSQKNEVVLIAEDHSGQVNMGIALVVPATKILEVINQPELAEMRKENHERQKGKGPKPTLDNVMTASTDPAEQTTRKGATIQIPKREDFLRDLAKATRRKKPS